MGEKAVSMATGHISETEASVGSRKDVREVRCLKKKKKKRTPRHRGGEHLEKNGAGRGVRQTQSCILRREAGDKVASLECRTSGYDKLGLNTPT